MASKRSKFHFYFLCFLFYAFCGYVYEEILECLIYRTGFTNRGFLYGPWLPVYGFGAILILFAFGLRLRVHPIRLGKIPVTPLVVFLLSALLATAVELLTSYLVEPFVQEPLWTYADYPLNFQGRIALDPSCRFGLGGVMGMYLGQPLMDRTIGKMEENKRAWLARVMLGIFCLDLILTLLFRV